MSGALVAEGYGVGLVCGVLGLAPSSYYRPAAPDGDEPLKAALKKAAGVSILILRRSIKVRRGPHFRLLRQRNN